MYYSIFSIYYYYYLVGRRIIFFYLFIFIIIIIILILFFIIIHHYILSINPPRRIIINCNVYTLKMDVPGLFDVGDHDDPMQGHPVIKTYVAHSSI